MLSDWDWCNGKYKDRNEESKDEFWRIWWSICTTRVNSKIE